jgi:hypothetical protein
MRLIRTIVVIIVLVLIVWLLYSFVSSTYQIREKQNKTHPQLQNIPVGSVLLENPQDCIRLYQKQNQDIPMRVRIRGLQSIGFTWLTNTVYQHGMLYIGDGNIAHTRSRYLGIDHWTQLPDNFIESSLILQPNIDLLYDQLCQNKDTEKDKNTWWSSYFNQRLKPIIELYCSNNISSDVKGIITTPYRRNKSEYKKEEYSKVRETYTCTGIISHWYSLVGVYLFEDNKIPFSGIYPRDFIDSKYFTIVQYNRN